MGERANVHDQGKRTGRARAAALALALACALHSAAAAAALIYGEVRGLGPEASFQVTAGGRKHDVKVTSGKYRVVLPPGQYVATSNGKRATLVSYPSSTRQDLTFK